MALKRKKHCVLKRQKYVSIYYNTCGLLVMPTFFTTCSLNYLQNKTNLQYILTFKTVSMLYMLRKYLENLIERKIQNFIYPRRKIVLNLFQLRKRKKDVKMWNIQL